MAGTRADVWIAGELADAADLFGVSVESILGGGVSREASDARLALLVSIRSHIGYAEDIDAFRVFELGGLPAGWAALSWVRLAALCGYACGGDARRAWEKWDASRVWVEASLGIKRRTNRKGRAIG